MKQKNIILIAVAVGCGLVAAILTSQLGATPKKVDDGVEVPVAAKELPVGTKMNKDDLKTLVTYKKVSKDLLPAEFAQTEDQIADKRLVRTVRAGETFNPQDLTTNTPISPPPGFNVMTFGATNENGGGGFAGPGSKVDVLASIPLKRQNKSVVIPILIDMLVLAIDANTQGAQSGVYQNLSMVSIAVKTGQAALLHGAITRGAQLRLILRNPDNPDTWAKIPTEEEIWKILADEPEKKDDGETPKPEAKATTIKLPVPTEEIKAGTQLTPDVLQGKFKLVDYTPPAPAIFVQDLKEHAGKFLQKDLAPEQFVPKTYLGDAPPKAPDQPKAPDVKPAPPKKPVDPPVYFDATVTTANGVKKYRYQVLKSGEYKFLGELKDDGSVQPAGPDGKPDPKSDDEKKRDKVV